MFQPWFYSAKITEEFNGIPISSKIIIICSRRGFARIQEYLESIISHRNLPYKVEMISLAPTERTAFGKYNCAWNDLLP